MHGAQLTFLTFENKTQTKKTARYENAMLILADPVKKKKKGNKAPSIQANVLTLMAQTCKQP